MHPRRSCLACKPYPCQTIGHSIQQLGAYDLVVQVDDVRVREDSGRYTLDLVDDNLVALAGRGQSQHDESVA